MALASALTPGSAKRAYFQRLSASASYFTTCFHRYQPPSATVRAPLHRLSGLSYLMLGIEGAVLSYPGFSRSEERQHVGQRINITLQLT